MMRETELDGRDEGIYILARGQTSYLRRGMHRLVHVIIHDPHREVIRVEKVTPNIIKEDGASQLGVG
jgi:hypothetical protein